MRVEPDRESVTKPAAGTLEGWAWDYLHESDLARKFELAPAPREVEPDAPARRSVRPLRPDGIIPAHKRTKTPGPEALRTPLRKAQIVHTFLHHELQAAELMCWAILAYPHAPEKFRLGLAKVARDEVRHMAMYADYLGGLGWSFGAFPIRDWFWERVPAARTPEDFVATMGIGFEGGNLDHTRRFAERFRAIGDIAGAALQETIFEEEIPHVRFALTWFRTFTGHVDFASWLGHLPAPLSPMVMRGHPIDREGRERAGFSASFIDELDQWQCKESGY